MTSRLVGTMSAVSAGDVVRPSGQRARARRSGRMNWHFIMPRFLWRCWSCCRITVSFCWTRSCGFWRTCFWPRYSRSGRPWPGGWICFRPARLRFVRHCCWPGRACYCRCSRCCAARAERADAPGFPPSRSRRACSRISKRRCAMSRRLSRFGRRAARANSWAPTLLVEEAALVDLDLRRPAAGLRACLESFQARA